MSTEDITPDSLYTRYFEEYGVLPDKPEYFMAYCRKYKVNLKYKECRQLFQNPPLKINGSNSSSIHIRDSSNEQEDEEEELKYNTDDLQHPISAHLDPKQSPSPATPSPINYDNHDYRGQEFQRRPPNSPKIANYKLLKLQTTNTQPVEYHGVDNSDNYISPQILVDKVIPINAETMDIISYHRKWNEVAINKCHIFRDVIFSILYWIGLINGIFDFINPFNLWYSRWICLMLWIVAMSLGLLCHHYYKSPPFYPLFPASDCQYQPKFDKSAMNYVREWNLRSDHEIINKDELNHKHIDRDLKIKIFYIEMFGGLSDSKCGYIDFKVQNIEDKSEDILENILNSGKNKLIRLRIYHILRFHDSDSHRKFVEILETETSGPHERGTLMFHLEYNVEVEERLLMNTTNDIYQNKTIWDGYNECCANRRMSYVWYIAGLGVVYRVYHDCCIKTQIYDCVKEVTL